MSKAKTKELKEKIKEAEKSAETPVMRVLAALGAEFKKRGKSTVVLNLPDGSQFVWFETDVMSMAVKQAAEDAKK